MAMTPDAGDSPSIMKFIGGVLFGVLTTFVYVRYAWTMPEVVQLPAMMTEAAIVTTAEMDLFHPNVSDEVRRRAFSVVMSQKADEFVAIDRELGSPLMEDVLRREAVRESKLLKHQMSAYQAAVDKPALRQALERKHGSTDDDQELKRRMLLSAIHDDEFTSWYLRTRFPQLTQRQWVDLVLNVYQHELRPETRVATQPKSALR
ncbi:MAG: hypothetical protein ABGZ35_23940 [Planctomycetaceae bacterium]|jgi:hypothetical protein